MKRSSLLQGAVALSMLTILAGCATTDPLSPQLHQAAAEQGRAAAGVTLPKWPARCAAATPHAALTVGTEALAVLKRERGQLDKANADKSWCAQHYGSLRAGLGKPGAAR